MRGGDTDASPEFVVGGSDAVKFKYGLINPLKSKKLLRRSFRRRRKGLPYMQKEVENAIWRLLSYIVRGAGIIRDKDSARKHM